MLEFPPWVFFLFSMGTRSSLSLIPISSQTLPIKSSCPANTKERLGGVTATSPALAKVADMGGTRGSELEALWSFPSATNSIKQWVANDSTVSSCHTCDSSPSAHPHRTHIRADYVIWI